MDAISYARASQDRTGEELSVERQLEDHRKLAKDRGLNLVAEIVDNDTSAAGKRKRPGFEQALTAIEGGNAQMIVATDMSRLTRGKSRDEVRLLELGLATGLKLSFVRAPDLDLSTAAGRLTASILIAAARHEIEQKGERQRRAAEQAAEQGRWIGGRRPFGYEADGVTIRQREAGPVVAAYEAVLAGFSMGSVASTWNELGLLTPQEKRSGGPSTWTGQTARSVLLNPRYAGLRSRVTEQMLKTMNPPTARLKNITGQAVWPGLVSEETWRATVDILTDPARGKFPLSGRGLLTGIALCGVCGSTVHRGAAPARDGRPGHPTYRCKAALGHIGRSSLPVDEYVGELVIARLERPDAADLLIDAKRPDAGELRRQAKALRSRLDGLASLLADGVLTEGGVRREAAKLRAKLAEVEADQAAAGRVNVLKDLVDSDDVRTTWESYITDRQRAVIGKLMTVTLLPPGRGTRTFRPETVVVSGD